jgi:hypothetical protein
MLASLGADGELSGTPIQVSPDDTRAGSADVAVRSDGVTLVVWWELQDTSRRVKIFGRFYSASLAPLGGEFVVFDDTPVTFPRVAAGPSNFSVAFRQSFTGDRTALVTLDHEGNRLWDRQFIEGDRATVSVLSNGNVYLGYDRGSDAFVQLLDGATGDDIGDNYRLSMPRNGDQQRVAVATTLGIFSTAAWGSTARYSLGGTPGMLDFVKLDGFGAPMDADRALVHNDGLPENGREVLTNQEVHVAGGASPFIAVLYNAEQFGDLQVGRRAKMMLMRAGATPCPEGVSCEGLIPFRTSGPAERRLNIVIRPALYEDLTGPTFEGRRLFYRDLREVVLSNVDYGSRQHREFPNKANYLVLLNNAEQIRCENPTPLSGCFSPFDEDPTIPTPGIVQFQERYPWVYAVAAQRNQRDCGLGQFCATIGTFANGGGYFFYGSPGGLTVRESFEHEAGHTLYGVYDEYLGGAYGEPAVPAPFATQYLSGGECQADATAEGWDPSDCRLFCELANDLGCGADWWTAELPVLEFATAEECTNYLTAKSLGNSVDGCFGDEDGGEITYRITGLTDLMGTGAQEGDPAVRTENYPRLTESFQRACERRVLNVLTDPGLAP